MPENKSQTTDFDWRLTSFEGARREQLRRWAQLPLERILLAIEEMQDIARRFEQMRVEGKFKTGSGGTEAPGASGAAAVPSSLPSRETE